MPGEAEKAAAFMGMTLRKFFKRFLGVNYGKEQHETESTFILAPAITTMKAGQEWPHYPLGQCVFFKNGRCSIHAVKPFECREYSHTDTKDEVQARHVLVKDAWKDHQGQIKELLGRQYPRSGPDTYTEMERVFTIVRRK